MAFKLLDAATAIGVSAAIRLPANVSRHTVNAYFKSLAATKISALTVNLQGSHTDDDAYTGLANGPALAIGSTAERFANGLFYFRIKGTNYNKAAVAAGSTFTAAHVVGDGAANVWGAINIYINADGTLISQVPAATQTYTTAALAHTAADAIERSASYCYVGRILLNANALTWTANTSDMTDASDITTATFLSESSTFIDLASHAFTADEITAQRASFSVSDVTVKFVRLYLAALTGTGNVTGLYTPQDRLR